LYTYSVTDRHIREQERAKTNREKLTFCSTEEIKRGYFSLLLSQASPRTAGPPNLKYLPPSQQPTKSPAGKCQSVLSPCKDCLPLFDQPEGDGRRSPPLLATVTKAANIYLLGGFYLSGGFIFRVTAKTRTKKM